MTSSNEPEERQGFCPVYDIECPSGPEAASDCDHRFTADYNPLTSFRDADIQHCAIYRREQGEDSQATTESKKEVNPKSITDGE